jgi:hypothetical protein
MLGRFNLVVKQNGRQQEACHEGRFVAYGEKCRLDKKRLVGKGRVIGRAAVFPSTTRPCVREDLPALGPPLLYSSGVSIACRMHSWTPSFIFRRTQPSTCSGLMSR